MPLPQLGQDKKEEIRLSHMAKALTPIENTKINVTTRQTPPKTSIIQRLRTKFNIGEEKYMFKQAFCLWGKYLFSGFVFDSRQKRSNVGRS